MNRFWLALRTFWRTLTEADFFVARVEPLYSDRPTRPGPPHPRRPPTRDGRLVDFLEEDIDGYADAEIGAAVRDIHRGCRKVLHDYLTIEPVLDGAEDSAVRVPADFDPAAVRLIGNVDARPPFQGVLKHHGWRVCSVRLPVLPTPRDDSSVLSPAEVELP